MRLIKLLAVFFLVLAGGCIKQTLYVSEGEVRDGYGREQQAKLYWHNSEGRLWYGKKWEGRRQNFATLIVGCSGLSPKFKAVPEKGMVLKPVSPGRDRIVAEETNGDVKPLAQPRPTNPGSECGRILDAMLPKDIETAPAVDFSILCRSCDPDTNPNCTPARDAATGERLDLFPEAGRYTLGPVRAIESRYFAPPGEDPSPSVECGGKPAAKEEFTHEHGQTD